MTPGGKTKIQVELDSQPQNLSLVEVLRFRMSLANHADAFGAFGGLDESQFPAFRIHPTKLGQVDENHSRSSLLFLPTASRRQGHA